MTSFLEEKRKFLDRNTTYSSDNLTDLERAFYMEQLSVTSGQIKDLELAWLVDKGYTEGTINDRWWKLTTDEGYSGSLTRRMIQYFQNN